MTKNIFPFIAICCLILSSCTTDIEVNTPGLQATIDGKLYRPDIKKAILNEDGTLIIQGITGAETISFTTKATQTGTYKLSDQAIDKISFYDGESKFISEEQETNGEVVITEIHNNEITGSFFFRNLKNSDGETISFQNGWFYRLPLENFADTVDENEDNVNPCLLNASLVANIDSVEMISTNHSAVTQDSQVSTGSIIITAKNNFQEIQIVFPTDAPVGQHNFDTTAYNATYTGNDKSGADSGMLTIIEHDQDSKCITGSFEFMTRSGITVSEGQFDFGY